MNKGFTVSITLIHDGITNKAVQSMDYEKFDSEEDSPDEPLMLGIAISELLWSLKHAILGGDDGAVRVLKHAVESMGDHLVECNHVKIDHDLADFVDSAVKKYADGKS